MDWFSPLVFTGVFAGYEPNLPCFYPLMRAMAELRARSVPLDDIPNNPFWSKKVREELELARARPTDLPPVPRGDDSLEEGSRSRRGVGAQLQGSEAGSVADEKKYKTPPSSWTDPAGPLRIEGMMEEESEELEDQRLREELDRMRMKSKEESLGSNWTEVDMSPVPEPPPQQLGPRWTPNGTRVPDGPPPPEPDWSAIPKWPDSITPGYYETEADDGMRKWLGLPPPPVAGRRHRREGDGGVNPRHVRGQGFCGAGGGIHSRQEQDHGLESRVQALHAELELAQQQLRFQRTVEQEDRRMHSAYWASLWKEAQGEGPPHGVRGGDRAQAFGSELPEHGRAKAYGHGVCDGDRALHECAGDARTRYHAHREGHHQHHGGIGGDLPGVGSRGRSPSENEHTKRALEEEIESLKKRLEESEKRGKESKKEEEEERTRNDRESVDHTLKSVQVVLPKLAEPGSKNSSLEAGDWLAQVRPYIADVGQGAEKWWDQTTMMVMNQYGRWLEANPLERVHIKAPDIDQSVPGSDRLNQRVTTLLLSAVPESIKTELITTRQLSVSGVLFAILRRYQPGGLAEKTYTLSELTTTSPASTASQAVQRLRQWKRQQTRASELGLTLPDPLIMVKALDAIMVDLWPQHPQASFRVSAFRMHQQIDVRPTMASLENLYDLLLAEADQMVYGKTGDVGEKEQKPSVKMLQQQPSRSTTQPSSTVKVCSFWGTEKGCRLGRACRYLHGLAWKTRHRDVGYALQLPMSALSVRHELPGGVGPMEIVENEKMGKEKEEKMVKMEVKML